MLVEDEGGGWHKYDIPIQSGVARIQEITGGRAGGYENLPRPPPVDLHNFISNSFNLTLHSWEDNPSLYFSSDMKQLVVSPISPRVIQSTQTCNLPDPCNYTKTRFSIQLYYFPESDLLPGKPSDRLQGHHVSEDSK
jgi:hypothetical protein